VAADSAFAKDEVAAASYLVAADVAVDVAVPPSVRKHEAVAAGIDSAVAAGTAESA
jgi:hypothetical protein